MKSYIIIMVIIMFGLTLGSDTKLVLILCIQSLAVDF